MSMDMDIFLKIILVVLGFSGWIKIFYDHQATKPKLVGRVMNVVLGGQTSGDLACRANFALYIYLLNARKNSVHILDYGVRVKIDGRWSDLDRVYGIERIGEICFSDSSGKDIVVKNFAKNVIYMKKEAIQYGIPMHGWIVFSGPESMLEKQIDEYELMCIDAYGIQHKIRSKQKDMVNLALLSQVAEIQIPVGYSSVTAK